MSGEKRLIWGCIADDFTGASDAASFFVKGGMQTVLYSGVPAEARRDQDCEAIVIALKTRTQEKSAAVDETLRAARWLKNQGAGQLYIKYCSTFDSTPEGNIGPILDALLEEYDVPYTVLCPALPVNGRVVRGGRLYVNGVPLHESPMKDHPLTPMWDSDLAALMEPQSRYSCVKIAREQYAAEQERIWEMLKAYGETHDHFYVIPDYETDADAAAIAELFGSLPVLSGGSGILTELAGRCGGSQDGEMHGLEMNSQGMHGHGMHSKEIQSEEIQSEEIQSNRTVTGRKNGSGLLLAGSCSEMTRKQIACAMEHGVAAVKIQPLELLSGRQSVESLWEFIERNPGKDVLLYSSDAPEQVREIQETGKEQVAALLEQTIAALAKRAVEAGYTRIIVAGGETSGAVTRALEFDSYLIGESVAPGVPVMIPRNRREIRLVLKSGNFGQEDFFLRALEMTDK